MKSAHYSETEWTDPAPDRERLPHKQYPHYRSVKPEDVRPQEPEPESKAERNARIVKDYKSSGDGQRVLARRYGLAKSTVRDVLRKAGIYGARQR